MSLGHSSQLLYNKNEHSQGSGKLRARTEWAYGVTCVRRGIAHNGEMDLDKESIEEFKAIWKKEFQENLTDEQARPIAGQFLELYRVLYLGDLDSLDDLR